MVQVGMAHVFTTPTYSEKKDIAFLNIIIQIYV